jgi:threonine/homoserine/homoserine lactone efflux protein
MLAGASGGRLFRLAPLLVAELVAYVVSVLCIGFAIDRLLGSVDGLRLVLQFTAAVYLGFTAARLWRQGPVIGTPVLVTPQMVALTTLSNPKALIITTAMIPARAYYLEPALLLQHMAVMALLIPIFGTLWFVLGVTIANGRSDLAKRALPRLSALALAVFSVLMLRNAVAF